MGVEQKHLGDVCACCWHRIKERSGPHELHTEARKQI
jgi:hypothetical protein